MSTKRIAIEDHNEVIGEFVFDTDKVVPDNIVEHVQHIPDIVRPLGGISISKDGTATGADVQILCEVEGQLYRDIDDAFGEATAEKLFRKRRPFACVDGEFWVTKLLPEIVKMVTRREAE